MRRERHNPETEVRGKNNYIKNQDETIRLHLSSSSHSHIFTRPKNTHQKTLNIHLSYINSPKMQFSTIPFLALLVAGALAAPTELETTEFEARTLEARCRANHPLCYGAKKVEGADCRCSGQIEPCGVWSCPGKKNNVVSHPCSAAIRGSFRTALALRRLCLPRRKINQIF